MRLAHSSASSFDRTCQSQNPATNSFVSVNRPSTTLRLCPEYLTRAPLELACSPSPANITPAFTSSSLKFPLSVSISFVGSLPASESLFAFTITRNRIVVSPLLCHSERSEESVVLTFVNCRSLNAPLRGHPARDDRFVGPTITSNGRTRNR